MLRGVGGGCLILGEGINGDLVGAPSVSQPICGDLCEPAQHGSLDPKDEIQSAVCHPKVEPAAFDPQPPSASKSRTPNHECHCAGRTMYTPKT